ncbi:hypothetical protein [Nocardia spumae]|uniref:hypothetical protein n=1 Tax=Nocardia spumae TaxID=2887190 RepID=UPI001D1589D7|nr:hypothetical protein [Nocardia spumae]
MRIISSRCLVFEYEVTTAGPCAVALDPLAVGNRNLFMDSLVLKIAVEPGDAAVASTAVEIIKTIANRTDAGYIVVDGIARWTRTGDSDGARLDVLTGLADALDVLSEVTERLEERGELVHLMPFGWNTIRHTDIRGERWPVRVTHLSPGLPMRARQQQARSPRITGSCRTITH